MQRDKIVAFCENYLKVKFFQDYCHNGLQVEGTAKIRQIIGGVSLSKRLIEAAIKKKAQMIIVHHGFFGNSFPQPPVIKSTVKGRLELLLKHEINLCGFHLPLDAHPEIGNNISLCRSLGVKNPKTLDIGFIGSLDKKTKLKDFAAKVDRLLGSKSFVLAFGSPLVQRIAVISGAASAMYEIVSDAGADVFLCGDIKESSVRGIEEHGLNLINAGHYNTEKMGVQNLLKVLAKKFKVKAEFVDVPCEV